MGLPPLPRESAVREAGLVYPWRGLPLPILVRPPPTCLRASLASASAAHPRPLAKRGVRCAEGRAACWVGGDTRGKGERRRGGAGEEVGGATEWAREKGGPGAAAGEQSAPSATFVGSVHPVPPPPPPDAPFGLHRGGVVSPLSGAVGAVPSPLPLPSASLAGREADGGRGGGGGGGKGRCAGHSAPCPPTLVDGLHAASAACA